MNRSESALPETAVEKLNMYAYVKYLDGEKSILPVSLIKKFRPASIDDLDPTVVKLAYWRSEAGEEENYYPANIMMLGGECFTSCFPLSYLMFLMLSRKNQKMTSGFLLANVPCITFLFAVYFDVLNTFFAYCNRDQKRSDQEDARCPPSNSRHY